MPHKCHARGCTVKCKPEFLMCPSHWSKVPPDLKRAVWAAYRVGQCDDKRPSRGWLHAADMAINAVAVQEMGRRAAEDWIKKLQATAARTDGAPTPAETIALIRRFYPEVTRGRPT